MPPFAEHSSLNHVENVLQSVLKRCLYFQGITIYSNSFHATRMQHNVRMAFSAYAPPPMFL
jgi:hypothetical protein